MPGDLTLTSVTLFELHSSHCSAFLTVAEEKLWCLWNFPHVLYSLFVDSCFGMTVGVRPIWLLLMSITFCYLHLSQCYCISPYRCSHILYVNPVIVSLAFNNHCQFHCKYVNLIQWRLPISFLFLSKFIVAQ